MPKPITISSILGGHSESYYIGSKNTFLSSIAVDPDLPIPNQTKASGAIMPVGYEKFSTGLTGYPKWILTNPKNNKVYVYSTADFLRYDSDLTNETSIGNPTSGAGNGAEYYNDYIYLATPTDVSRYGKLSDTPSITNNYFTGLELSPLTNTPYPELRGTPIPNHPIFSHTDNSAYVGDVVDGQGVLHRIITDKDGANDGSAFNVIDFPFGLYPTSISNYGLDIVAGCIQTSSDTTVSQGKAVLIFWETTNVSTFYRIIHLQDEIITALKNINGTLYIWSGTISSTRISKYLGGDVLQEVSYIPDSPPPTQGAVDAIGNKLLWGGIISDTAVVYSFGSFNKFPSGLHCVARATSTGDDKNVTALKIVSQNGRLAIGSGSDTDKQLDKYSATATLASVWKSEVFSMATTFLIKSIRIQLGGAVSTNTIITPKVYIDDGSDSTALQVINATNYDNSQRIITLPANVKGNSNFYIEFTMTGSTPLPITLPITVNFEILKP